MTTGLCVLLRSKWTLTRDWKRTQRWQDDQATKRRLNTRHVETNSLDSKHTKSQVPKSATSSAERRPIHPSPWFFFRLFDFSSVHTWRPKPQLKSGFFHVQLIFWVSVLERRQRLTSPDMSSLSWSSLWQPEVPAQLSQQHPDLRRIADSVQDVVNHGCFKNHNRRLNVGRWQRQSRFRTFSHKASKCPLGFQSLFPACKLRCSHSKLNTVKRWLNDLWGPSYSTCLVFCLIAVWILQQKKKDKLYELDCRWHAVCFDRKEVRGKLTMLIDEPGMHSSLSSNSRSSICKRQWGGGNVTFASPTVVKDLRRRT